MVQMNKQKISFIGTIISIIAGFVSALTLKQDIGIAKILTLFFCGFAAGATLVNAIRIKKENKFFKK
jgi:hypothetical protein